MEQALCIKNYTREHSCHLDVHAEYKGPLYAFTGYTVQYSIVHKSPLEAEEWSIKPCQPWLVSELQFKEIFR